MQSMQGDGGAAMPQDQPQYAPSMAMPLPAPPSSGGGHMLAIVVLVIGGIVAYYIYTQQQQKAASLAAATTSAADAAQEATAQAQAAATQAQAKAKEEAEKTKQAQQTAQQQLTALASCKTHEIPAADGKMTNGTCLRQGGTGIAYMQCEPDRYGTYCADTCPKNDTNLVVYKPGQWTGAANPDELATCECPSTYKFKDRDLHTGCRPGIHCADGWWGPKCDVPALAASKCQKWGKGAGAVDSENNKCRCAKDYEGEYCDERPAGYCTSKDKGAMVSKSTGDCVCSKGFTGTRCEEVEKGYVIDQKGDAVVWTTGWENVSDKNVRFAGHHSADEAGHIACGNTKEKVCTKDVNICKLLTRYGQGCWDMHSLCTQGIVPTYDKTCMLYQRGADDKHLGLGNLNYVSADEGIDMAVKYDTWNCKDKMNNTFGPAPGTYEPHDREKENAFQFVPAKGTYAVCDGHYYVGEPTDDARLPDEATWKDLDISTTKSMDSGSAGVY